MDEVAKRKPGRPRKPDALSKAESQRRVREKHRRYVERLERAVRAATAYFDYPSSIDATAVQQVLREALK